MNNKDYYKTLGVDRSATQDDIKKAFRKMAHEHHPDKKTGNPEKFKEASEAYSTLSDPEKRKQYDTYGSAFSGGAGGFGGSGGQGFGGFDFSGFQQGFSQNGQHVEFDLGDIFSEFFGGGGGRRRVRKGADIAVDVEITFKECIYGTEKPIRIRKDNLTVKIPPGIDDGEMLRVNGRGEPIEGGNPGDLYIKVHVAKNPLFKKEGVNLVMNMPIKLSEALLGIEKKIETVDGEITVGIPTGINHGEVLRVKNRGVVINGSKRGDLFLKISIIMPKKLSRNAKKIIEDLEKEGL